MYLDKTEIFSLLNKGSWNFYFSSFAIPLGSFLSLLFGTGCTINFFGSRDGLDLIVCSKPFKRETVVLTKILAIVVVSIYIGFLTFISSLFAFLADGSKTPSKSFFFLECFLSSCLSFLFFSTLTAIFSYYFSPKGSRICVITAKIFFSSILGGLGSLISLFSLSTSLSSLSEEGGKKVFGGTDEGNFSKFTLNKTLMEDNIFYFNNSTIVSDKKTARSDNLKNLPKIGFNTEQIDILKRIADISIRSELLPRILYLFNIPYQLSNIGLPSDRQRVDSFDSYYGKDFSLYPVFLDPKASFSFRTFYAKEISGDYSLLPLRFKHGEEYYFAVPSFLTLIKVASFETIPNSILTKLKDVAKSRDFDNNKLNIKIKDFFAYLSTNFEGLQPYIKGVNIPIRLVNRLKHKSNVDVKKEIIGAINLKYIGYLTLFSDDFRKSIDSFVTDSQMISKIKTGSDLNVRLINHLRSDTNLKDNDSYSRLLLNLIVSYLLIYMNSNYPLNLRKLVLEAINKPVNIDGKDYMIGLPVDPLNKVKTDSLFMPISNFIVYSINYKTINFAIHMSIWLVTTFLLFVVIFLIYRRKEYR